MENPAKAEQKIKKEKTKAEKVKPLVNCPGF